MGEVRLFLDSILAVAKIPEERIQEVIHHYEIFNGRSPYNELTEHQRSALEAWFKHQDRPLPVYVGLRHSKPSFRETFLELNKKGVKSVIGFVLSGFRSYASYEKYIEKLEEAWKEAGVSNIQIKYTGPFYNNSLFVEAQADRIKETLQKNSSIKLRETYFLFSAHSIPKTMSDKSGYADQFQKTSSLIAQRLKLEHWGIGTQSRSGSPRESWLDPDVKEVIAKLDKNCFKNVVLIPVGFLCENIEILYDLDTEIKAFCDKNGFSYFRAGTVADHPKFIEMMGRQALDLWKGQ